MIDLAIYYVLIGAGVSIAAIDFARDQSNCMKWGNPLQNAATALLVGLCWPVLVCELLWALVKRKG